MGEVTGQSHFTVSLSSSCDGALILMRSVLGHGFSGEQVFSEGCVDKVLDLTVDDQATLSTDAWPSRVLVVCMSMPNRALLSLPDITGLRILAVITGVTHLHLADITAV